jgi:5-methyltetrahydropteroyltriglutamate--homocysteine methyltransferase
MMSGVLSMKIANLGFPRIGRQRELKFALEKYWRGELTQAELVQVADELKQIHWQWQADAGVELIPVGDFAYYDHVLTLSATLNALPARHREKDSQGNPLPIGLDTLFRVARGRAPSGHQACAAEMTKYFNTNYHYQVPELYEGQQFSIGFEQIFDEVTQAQQLGHKVKPVLLGPVSYLHLSKTLSSFDKLSLLPSLVKTYAEILQRFSAQGVTWVQLDEPVLGLDLPPQWQQAIQWSYAELNKELNSEQNVGKGNKINLLLASYYASIAHNQAWVSELPVAGLHLDLVTAPEQLALFASKLKQDQVLSLGVINGRNVWAADLPAISTAIAKLVNELKDRAWLAPSCSLLHTPVTLETETKLAPELKGQLAFAKEKLQELKDLRVLLLGEDSGRIDEIITANLSLRKLKAQAEDKAVTARVAALTPNDSERNLAYSERIKLQRASLKLPLLPTTSIGSFPQTPAIRGLRSRWRKGEITESAYQDQIRQVTQDSIKRQLDIGIDVLVHGEAERNDMVEYFGEQLAGFAFTEFAWVQSYGSRCVKPPLIYADVSRPNAMTVDITSYAQSLTTKPVKGMLTGPVTILHWSFAREDISREVIAKQIALAIRDEACDLERAGIRVIQIDEPAFREGLPIKASDWDAYLAWAVNAFRLSASGVKDSTQIHTHMCYSEFNETIAAIAAMDADVITIETSRSHMDLLDAFEDFHYPNDIGPGVYDIHSPNTPTEDEIVALINKAATKIPVAQLWVNPDCGLKTRTWDEVEPALNNMVAAAKTLRRSLA